MDSRLKVVLIGLACALVWSQSADAQGVAYLVTSDGSANAYPVSADAVVYVFPQRTYSAQPTAGTTQDSYTLVQDSAGQQYYVSVSQSVEHRSTNDIAPYSMSFDYVSDHSHHSPASVLAPAVRNTRSLVGDVAEVCLKLHPGAWLAEKAGLIKRNRIVQRIRGHQYGY
jgi:hypothetical protein